MLSSYPSVFNLGHAAVATIFHDTVSLSEKIDGSQFSFGVDENGLHMRSRGSVIDAGHPPKLFAKSVEHVLSVAHLLVTGYTYRGEALTSLRHNAITYGREPTGNIVLFDVEDGPQYFLQPEKLAYIASLLGVDYAPQFFHGVVKDPSMLEDLLKRESILGGEFGIEGVVIKGYGRFGSDKKTLMAKHVRPEFREVHKATWREDNPTRSDVIALIASRYATPQRWAKAVQHLDEAGKLQWAPQDIGPLIKEAREDILKECEDEIGQELFKHFKSELERKFTFGLPEWYKGVLLERQPFFEVVP